MVVWCSPQMASQLPHRSWLDVKTPSLLSGTRLLRPFWPAIANREIAGNCDVLLVPGGLSFGRFIPMVTMSRNLLPFDVSERRRYGWSLVGIRLRLLELLQTATFRRATATIFLTRTAQRIVENRTGALGRSEVIPHGVSAAFKQPPRRKEPFRLFDDRPFRLVSDPYWSAITQSVGARVTSLRQRRLQCRSIFSGRRPGRASGKVS